MTTVGRSKGLPAGVKMALFGLLAVALFFFVLDQRETRKLQQQALDQQAELIQQQQTALDQQQTALEKQLQTVDSVVDRYEGHIEQQKAEQEMADVLRSRQMNFAYVASGLSLASSLKVHVAEHYMMEGQFPDSNDDVGLPSPKRMGNDGVQSVGIGQKGVIRLVYGAETGIDGGVLLLRPKALEQTGRIDWTCTTADYPDITSAIPNCRYVDSE